MLPTIKAPGTSFEALEDVGVSIKETEPDQRHIGLVFRVDGEPVSMCHLAFHHDLRVEPPSETYGWVQSDLDEISRRLVASAIAAIARKKPTYEIAYSPFYQGIEGRPVFDPINFSYIRGLPGDGLTCATFVLAVFESVGIALLDRPSWEPREDDKQFFDHIIACIEQRCRGNGVAEHVAAMRQHPIEARYRPEEVAAGVGSPGIPLSFQRACGLAQLVLQALTLPIP